MKYIHQHTYTPIDNMKREKMSFKLFQLITFSYLLLINDFILIKLITTIELMTIVHVYQFVKLRKKNPFDSFGSSSNVNTVQELFSS